MTAAGRPPSRSVLRAARTLHTTTDKIYVFRRLILTSFLVTLAVFGARKAHLLDGVENRWLDLMANADRPSFDVPIVVVGISDKDYYDPSLFGGTSPLEPGALGRMVSTVLAHKPRGVVLDVLIHPSPGESPQRSIARENLYRLLLDASEFLPIVVVRDPASEALERRIEEPGWRTFDALTKNPHLTCASAGVRRSRGYVRAIPLRYQDDDPAVGNLPTVLGATVTAMGLESEHSSSWLFRRHENDPVKPRRIRFSKCFLEAGSSVDPHYVDSASLLSQAAIPGARSLLRDQIVLVGGTFHAGRDVLPTVVGDMAGVYVWAEAIASWIRGDALREPLELISFLLEFFIGVLAGYLLVRLGPFFGFVSSLAVVGPLTIFFSLLTFGDRVQFVNFLPSFLGVYLHYQYYQIEVHSEIRRLKAEIARLSPPVSPSE